MSTSPRLLASGACTMGAKTFVKLRAATEPVTRSVCCKTPRTAFTVFTVGAPACFAAARERNCHTAPAAMTTIAITTKGQRLRSGGDGTISRLVRGGAGVAEEDGDAMANFYCNPIGDTRVRDIPRSSLLQ